MMNNDTFENLLLDYVEGLLPEDVAEAMRLHAQTNPDCAEQLVALEDSMRLSRRLFAQEDWLEPPASLDRNILQMAEQTAAKKVPAVPVVDDVESQPWWAKLFAMPSFQPVLAFCTLTLLVGGLWIASRGTYAPPLLKTSGNRSYQRVAPKGGDTLAQRNRPLEDRFRKDSVAAAKAKRDDNIQKDEAASGDVVPTVRQQKLKKVSSKSKGTDKKFRLKKRFATPPPGGDAPGSRLVGRFRGKRKQGTIRGGAGKSEFQGSITAVKKPAKVVIRRPRPRPRTIAVVAVPPARRRALRKPPRRRRIKRRRLRRLRRRRLKQPSRRRARRRSQPVVAGSEDVRRERSGKPLAPAPEVRPPRIVPRARPKPKPVDASGEGSLRRRAAKKSLDDDDVSAKVKDAFRRQAMKAKRPKLQPQQFAPPPPPPPRARRRIRLQKVLRRRRPAKHGFDFRRTMPRRRTSLSFGSDPQMKIRSNFKKNRKKRGGAALQRAKLNQTLFYRSNQRQYLDKAISYYQNALGSAKRQNNVAKVRSITLAMIRLYVRALQPHVAERYVRAYVASFPPRQRAAAYRQVARAYQQSGDVYNSRRWLQRSQRVLPSRAIQRPAQKASPRR